MVRHLPCRRARAYSWSRGSPGDTDGDAGEWLCFIERRVGLFRRLRGERKDDVAAIVPNTIHHVLSNAGHVSDIRWHFKSDFDALDEKQWAPEPDSAAGDDGRRGSAR